MHTDNSDAAPVKNIALVNSGKIATVSLAGVMRQIRA